MLRNRDERLLRFVNFVFQLFVETRPDFAGQFDRLVVAENLDGQLRLPDDDGAAFALLKMLFQLDANRSFELAVDVTRDLVNGGGAVQLGFLSRKKRSSFWRSFNRARSSRDFTAGTEIPIACAVSSVDKLFNIAEHEHGAEVGIELIDHLIENFVKLRLRVALLGAWSPVLDFARDQIVFALDRFVERNLIRAALAQAASALRWRRCARARCKSANLP